MRKIKSRLLLFASALIATALVAAACGGGEPTAAPPPPTNTPVPATAAPPPTDTPEPTAMPQPTTVPPTPRPRPTPTPTPIPAPVFGGVPDLPNAQYGGTLMRTNSAEGPTWDPLTERTQNTQDPVSPMFDQLLISHPNEQSQLVPQIATTWEISADNLTYTFGIRDDITFHNGNALTSSDVAWSIEILRSPPEGYSPINRGLVGSIASIDTPDDRTVVLNLGEPDNAFLYAMGGHGRLHILDQETVEGSGGVASLTEWPPIGSGPFMGEPGGHDQGVGVEVLRNPNYYVDGRPFVDSMQWFFIPDRGAQEAAFLAGQLSILTVNTGAGIDEINSRLADEAFIQEVADTVFWDLNLDFHSEDSPFTDIRVREAVSYALNRAEAVELIRQGRGVLGGVIIPGTGWEIPTSELLEYAGYTETVDEGVAKAKALLAEAGYPDGFESTIWTRNHPAYLTPTVAMQEQLERIGIRANIVQAEQAVFFAEQRNLDVWDMQSGGHRYTGTDPNFMIREFYLTDATRNLNYFTDADVDRLFSEQNLEADPGKRRELVNQIEHIVVSFYGNPVLYYNKANYAMYNYVKNQEYHASYGSNQDFRDVWIER